jgi:hypothetical protein
MQLFVEQSDLEIIYSSVPKLIISDLDKNALNRFNLENQFSIYQLNIDPKLDNSYLIAINQQLDDLNKEDLVKIETAPNFCWGLLSFSDAARNELNQLLSWWSSKGSTHSLPSVLKFNLEQETVTLQSEFWQQMYDLSSQQTHNLAQRIASLQKQYLGLRTLHEDMQNAFATVEDYLSQAKLPPIQLAFDTQTTDRSIEPSTINDSNSATLKQLLPVASRGLALIELHVAKVYSQAVGYLKIQLKACENNTAMATWQVPYHSLSTGWLSLDLPSIDLGRKKDVELSVEWETELGPAPSLSLTKLQPIIEARAWINNVVLEYSLNLRLWRGLPGTRKVTSPYLLLTDNSTNKVALPQLGYLGQGAIAGVEEVTPNLSTDDFEHIQVFDHGAKILTHPRADGTATIAMLTYCFPPTANQLTASVATEHEAAGIIEYAIAIIDPEVDPKTAFNPNTALAFSDWIAVEPNTPRKISLNLDIPVSKHSHIVIGTKLVKGSPTDFAWSHWLNFYTAIAEPQITKTEAVQPSIKHSPQLQLRNASLNSTPSKFEQVQLIPNEGKIQVHPLKGEETVAILSNIIQPGITKIRSIVCTENEAAAVVEYAIAMITTDDDTAARLAVTSPIPSLGFSGWHEVEAQTFYSLELDLVIPTIDSCHLVLATRLPEDSSQSNAWARWLKIEFD